MAKFDIKKASLKYGANMGVHFESSVAREWALRPPFDGRGCLSKTYIDVLKGLLLFAVDEVDRLTARVGEIEAETIERCVEVAQEEVANKIRALANAPALSTHDRHIKEANGDA